MSKAHSESASEKRGEDVNLSPAQSRLIKAERPYGARDTPYRKDGISCGWHSFRALWLLADNLITKFHICDLKVVCDRLKQRSRRYPEVFPLLKLERSKELASAIDKISIYDSKTRIQAAVLREVPLHVLTHSEQKTLHGWNKMSP